MVRMEYMCYYPSNSCYRPKGAGVTKEIEDFFHGHENPSGV
jgi:hypothetical protein